MGEPPAKQPSLPRDDITKIPDDILTPVLPEGKATLHDFISMSRRKVDVWMQAGHQASDRLAELEAATCQEADKALRERARKAQLDFER